MVNRKLAVIGLGTALTVAVTGCSTKGTNEGGGGGSDGVKTDIGVTDDEITLGGLTDASGPFKTGGVLVTHGNELWAKEVNDDGGICGRQIKLDVRDTGYKADQAIPLYDTLQNEAVGLIQIIGSAVFAAIKQKMISSSTMGSSPTIASDNLDNEVMVGVTTTFDIEAINGLAWMAEQGMIKDGDKIGAIYLQNEAGQNSFHGVEAYAQKHNIQVIGAPASPTDTDMTATVTKFKAEGVSLIYIAMPPAATASTAVQMQGQGLNVPLLGFNSAFQPNMLEDAGVVAAMQENFYLLPPGRTWGSDSEASTKLREQYEASGIQDDPAHSVVTGYLSGLVWGAILEQACEDGDLTRAGLLKARKQVTELDTGGLTQPLDYSDPGDSPTRANLIAQIDPDAPGGLKEVSDWIESDEAKEYKLPHQQ
ncbi:ABC transporter substrate-binding protein [Blastococcus sp. Marseille-P5729]|uniref:ABC transporter substrate-binding protein n=1 Tax=Blastococcus sp. Marseille-P5729 TaxID=2086582 RepID=UPI00131C5740|nr:ABC transporter substrate-binding protein [Blastococcus sp. Marseille-P5729]